MIRIEEIKLSIDQDESILKKKIISILQLSPQQLFSFKITKKAIDSRFYPIRVVFSVNVTVAGEDDDNIISSLTQSKIFKIRDNIKNHRIQKLNPYDYLTPLSTARLRKPIIIIGAGPCGLFTALILAKAGLQPIVVEQGQMIEQRIADVEKFFNSGILNPKSNIQFGEGGAGTFSDGKLYTLINNYRTSFIFQTLVECGAPSEILYDAKPHIGTDNLQRIVKNLRELIISLGGSFKFDSQLTGLNIKQGALYSVNINKTEEIQASALILAVGHSARDTFEMLYHNNIHIIQKSFSVGVRIEHPASHINKIQYGDFHNHPLLPVAKYKLATHLPNGRGVYTFCMCPGGYVVPAASEENMLVINGMSRYKQDGINSNSAVLVSVQPSDFGSSHPLAGIEFQRQIEHAAFNIGGANYNAPTQLLSDFLQDRASHTFYTVMPSYKPNTTLAEIKYCFPDFIVDSLKAGIIDLNKKMKGFALDDAVLTAPETRSSAPIRIVRDNYNMASIKNIFPAGEGSGYSGGIVSSALDGIITAEKIIALFEKKR